MRGRYGGAAVPCPGAHLAVPREVRPLPERGTAAPSPLGVVMEAVSSNCEAKM